MTRKVIFFFRLNALHAFVVNHTLSGADRWHQMVDEVAWEWLECTLSRDAGDRALLADRRQLTVLFDNCNGLSTPGYNVVHMRSSGADGRQQHCSESRQVVVSCTP
jgi:hypothetical protein